MRRRLKVQSATVSPTIPFLLAFGSVVLLALRWRLSSAPRSELRSVAPDAATSSVAEPAVEPLRHVAAASATTDAQLPDAGFGPLYHRRYEVMLTDTTLSPGMLLRLMQRHLCHLAPSALAHFEKSEGQEGLTRVNDEYDITMLGPWNGRVRVIESLADRFTLVTLDGHPEAGHITFSVTRAHGTVDALQVLIESWARARDALVAAAYGTLGIGKQVQTEVWITFLQRLSTLAGIPTTPEVQIVTDVLSADERAQASEWNA
jgi:Domain of unknown function (DUF1990)